MLFGLQVTAIGVTTVFVALTLLMFIIGFQSKILAQIENGKKKVEPEKVEAPKQVIQTNSQSQEDDESLAAVIAAAIHAFSGQQVIIRTITRVPGNTGAIWSTAGRTDSMNLRQL